jgi:hypothetical protein
MRFFVIALGIAFGISDAKATELVLEDCIDRVCISEHDPESEEYLKKVLTAMDLAYSVKTKEGRNVIIWKSESKEQEKEILTRVSEYFFVRDICKELPLPTPGQPAKPELSC